MITAHTYSAQNFQNYLGTMQLAFKHVKYEAAKFARQKERSVHAKRVMRDFFLQL